MLQLGVPQRPLEEVSPGRGVLQIRAPAPLGLSPKDGEGAEGMLGGALGAHGSPGVSLCSVLVPRGRMVGVGAPVPGGVSRFLGLGAGPSLPSNHWGCV